MPEDKPSDNEITANPGYAVFQIAKALSTSETHEDAATRERARQKVSKWAGVLQGMISGMFQVGSRQPISANPLWATPEVVTGGFVTGRLLAAGELQPHEEEWLKTIGQWPTSTQRHTLNFYCVSDAGLAELADRLRSRCYDIVVPEEGALLTVAWLAGNGHAEAARNLLDILLPHFSSLRFYPSPTQTPRTFGNRVYLEDVGSTRESIQRIEPNPQILTQREAIAVWTPLYDRMIALFLETVAGDLPKIVPDASGRWVSAETKKFAIAGGWPCQVYAEDWKQRALQVWEESERLRSEHPLCGRPNKSDDSFARLHKSLKLCADHPHLLSGRDVGRIRLILARHLTKRGEPSSARFQQLRARQARQIAAPTYYEVAGVVQQRLAGFPADGGLEDFDAAVRPVDSEEAGRSGVPEGSGIPPALRRKLSRCVCETAEVLVDRGIISSGETLAQVIPQFTAGLKAQAFDNLEVRHLYAAVYRAFRRRRSLLLLNLEKQVRLEELPWIAAIEPFRRQAVTARDVPAQALKELTILTLRSFPHAIIPNKLLQEFRALAQGAEMKLPLVEELAADIFMNDFSPKFTAAAKRAAQLVEGTLYAKYFGIECAAIGALPEAEPAPKNPGFRARSPVAVNPLVGLCIARAGLGATARWEIARNGMIIEQAQILTTQNLAVLFAAFNLARELQDDLNGMAERCLQWIFRRQQANDANRHSQLIMVKNTAYAWRQMIFFLSHLPDAQVQGFLSRAEAQLNLQTDGFQSRFAPALRGLVAVHAGQSLDDSSATTNGAIRFLGWTQTRHWILGAAP